MNDLEKDTLRTVLWFSLSEYAPTAFEIWKWMLKSSRDYSLFQVVDTLSTSKELGRVLLERDGTYVLCDMERGAEIRRERFSDALAKRRRLHRVVGYLRYIPFARGVAVCNTMSWMHTRPESDIDLFVIVREGSLWMTRLLAVLPFKLLRARPGEREHDPICFSFFLSDASLNLEALALSKDDPYLAYWTKSVFPIFDRDGVFDTFQKANRWTDEYLSRAYARGIMGEG